MGDDVGCVNVASNNMLSFTGESVDNVSDVAVEVGTQSSDFGEKDEETKEPSVDNVLDSQYYKNESRDKDTCRTTSPVEILKRNFGIRKTSVTGGDGNVETPRESDKVDSMLENLDQRRNRRTRLYSNSLHDEEENPRSEVPDLLTSLELEDPELHVSGGNRDSISADEHHRSKEHVYCTVYCIANDNYRKPSETTLSSEHGSPSQSDVYVLPHTDSSNSDPDPELDHFPEMYTLSDLVEPPMLNNVLYVGNVPLQCRVCLVVRSITSLHCCKKPVCEECMKTYITSQVVSGLAEIVCPIPECSGYLAESVVLAHLASENVAKYKYFLELGRLDSGTKTCPKCSLFTSLKGRGEPTHSKVEPKFKIQCSKCELVWCFRCHAPWHEGLKCREYRKGDKLLHNWASIIEHGQRNAQKCPRCKVHIQRVDGCDHMTCRQCNTNFCYRCGEKYRQLRFFGDHTSNLSVFGCKYRYLPEKPHLRRFIRGSVCAGKVLVAPVLIVLVVVIGALALVIGLVAFPIYYICKKNKHPNGMGRWLC
ncbi:probable E3 ubiquitin-protein ligase RNF217 [Tachysurus fulvidraco]|uniref:probable E3 ubiquitin-protein ligase RNF217 n=1 Tax=Tachysurus fulvidraco TaxID=1234273 RepID=UPI000F50BA0E|nr:probable E3 ubiquitin-protein ligase RNF217 [Tachysurus fulvidraco]